ncbi:MAG: hypothetical protein QF464_23695, partial [Myxococcota bacterium]|nr:hypothetical protein [Myxococcota bacterium]
DGDRFAGPEVPQSVFDMQNPYDSSWFETDEYTGQPLKGHADIAAIEATFYTIDICLMDGGTVVRGAEMDINRALDVAGTGKFDGYGDANERIESVAAYAEACVSQMGDIPFFPQIAEGDYETYSCLDSTPIPMTTASDKSAGLAGLLAGLGPAGGSGKDAQLLKEQALLTASGELITAKGHLRRASKMMDRPVDGAPSLDFGEIAGALEATSDEPVDDGPDDLRQVGSQTSALLVWVQRSLARF